MKGKRSEKESSNNSGADTDGCRLVTPEFRLSYPHLFKAVQFQGKGDPKYSITMLFSKKKDLSKLKLAIKHAKIAKYGPNKRDWPDDLDSPVVDGDDEKYADKDGYAGNWVIKASTREDSKPGVVDREGEDIIDPAQIYPGCYARAQVFARVWEFGGKQGVQFILDHVQKLRDGKSFGGKKSAQEAFAPLEDDSEDDEEDDGGFK